MDITTKQLETFTEVCYLLEYYMENFSDKHTNPDHFSDMEVLKNGHKTIDELNGSL